MVVVLLAALALAGCASERRAPSQLQNSPLDEARGADENARLYTDLIRNLIDQERFYAALAHLESRERAFGRTDELRLLRADIRRKMGDGEAARPLYEDLLDSRFSAQANHGIGLIVAPNDLAGGTRYLERAVSQSPTDARMRNDLGYALLRQGRIRDARLQLTTAYQLDGGNELNRNNYILLLLAMGETARAERIAANAGVSDTVMADMREQAAALPRAGASASRADVQPRQPADTSGMRDAATPARVGGGGG